MIQLELKLKGYRYMLMARAMAETYEKNRNITTYVHSTSGGHEAVQLALAFLLEKFDFVSPYYRDDALLLGLGFSPYELMLQLLAKREDIFSAGREYYAHPSYKGTDKPLIMHQSSATGMQAIPTTGLAHGLKYWENSDLQKIRKGENGELPVVVCSMGDASVTEGEVSEAWQVAVLHQLPVIYLVQDNDWGISVAAQEARAMNAYEYAAGFKGMKRIEINGADFEASYQALNEVIEDVRSNRGPWVVRARLPLLGHHTSGVRKEFYRSEEDWELHLKNDPLLLLQKQLLQSGITIQELLQIKNEVEELVTAAFNKAVEAPEPLPEEVITHIFAPTPVTVEKGSRKGTGKPLINMVDAGLYAIRELMEKHVECILYGQDVGERLGGVFREAATLGKQFGKGRVFNTAIQEAYIVGSTIGMSALGIKPIVEIQFADYIFPGLNQLATEVAKSNYLTYGKFPVSMVLRVPIGAYGGGGPYHSGSIETILLGIKGIKIAYPSNAADMKGLMKAAYYDPNPVIMLEHKGLYWSKNAGTAAAKTTEPDSDYVLPLGKANIVVQANDSAVNNGETAVVITYGMGVYWAAEAAAILGNRIEVVDLRTLYPLDEALIYERVKLHGKCLVLTEEQENNSFAEALSGKISRHCFTFLDAPVTVLGSLSVPAIPLNKKMEAAVLPNVEKLTYQLRALLNY